MNAFGLGIYPLEISSFYAMLIRTFETIQTNGRRSHILLGKWEFVLRSSPVPS